METENLFGLGGAGTTPQEPTITSGAWTAFHQAYDSAMRAYRRGENVSRAVNWLQVVSRDDMGKGEVAMERDNRELGVKLGASAGSEIEIAPLIWEAAKRGELKVEPRAAEAVEEDVFNLDKFKDGMFDDRPIPGYEAIGPEMAEEMRGRPEDDPEPPKPDLPANEPSTPTEERNLSPEPATPAKEDGETPWQNRDGSPESEEDKKKRIRHFWKHLF